MQIAETLRRVSSRPFKVMSVRVALRLTVISHFLLVTHMLKSLLELVAASNG